MRSRKKIFFLKIVFIFLCFYKINAQETTNSTTESTDVNETTTIQTPIFENISSGLSFDANYTCGEEKEIFLLNDESLEVYLKKCPKTRKVDVIGQDGLETHVFASFRRLKHQKRNNTVKISILNVTKVIFDDPLDSCSPLMNISLSNVKVVHLPRKLYDEGCVTFDKDRSMSVFIRSKEKPPKASNSVVKSLAAIIAILIIIVIALSYYSFCFVSPSRKRKRKEESIKRSSIKRSITVEPVDRLSIRRPTILPEVQRTIAEEAKNATLKKKKIPEEEIFEPKDGETSKTIETTVDVHVENSDEKRKPSYIPGPIVQPQVQRKIAEEASDKVRSSKSSENEVSLQIEPQDQDPSSNFIRNERSAAEKSPNRPTSKIPIAQYRLSSSNGSKNDARN